MADVVGGDREEPLPLVLVLQGVGEVAVRRVEPAARVQGDRHEEEEGDGEDVRRAQRARLEAVPARRGRGRSPAGVPSSRTGAAQRTGISVDRPARAAEVLEDLDVDAPAVEPGRGERRTGPVAVEQFEAALGVPYAGDRDRGVSGSCRPGPGFAHPVLVVLDRRAGHANASRSPPRAPRPAPCPGPPAPRSAPRDRRP